MYSEFHTYLTTANLLFNYALTRVILNQFKVYLFLAVKLAKEHQAKKDRRFVIW